MENLKRICVFFLITYNGLLAIGTDPIDCDFDDGFCNWTQGNGDHWKRLSGPTLTAETGPDADHTSGDEKCLRSFQFWFKYCINHGSRLHSVYIATREPTKLTFGDPRLLPLGIYQGEFTILVVGHYVYIDSSEERRNSKAKLSSPASRPGRYCLSLWYYMFGSDVDRLRVLKKEGTDRAEEEFRKTGNQDKKWIFEQIQINANENFKIIIEGRVKDRNNHDQGDIAIDDIVMFESEGCPEECSDPVLPEFGLANPVENAIGSKIQITCQHGYKVEGNSLIVCQANGIWSDSPVCNPIDCGVLNIDSTITVKKSEGTTYNKTALLACVKGFSLFGNELVTCQADGNWTLIPNCVINNCSDPTPESGKVNATNFHYGSVIQVTCIPGYRIEGHFLIICQANMTWSDSPECKQIDCGIRNITNGLFNASLGTTFGKIATQSCETGYIFEGDKTLSCYNSGWNGTFASCTLVDCGMPFLTNGIPAETPNGTTYTKIAVLACADGYTMIGNANVTCQADGKWATLPYCITEDSEVSALIAVYITVPLVVIVLVILLTLGILRKREAKKAKGHSATHVTDTHPIIQYPNETYNDYAVKNHAGPLEADESMAPDENYAEIDNDGVRETSENVYYNTFDADCSKKDFDHQYDHTKATSKTFTDTNYSHITGNVSDTKFEPNYDKVQRFDTNIEPIRSDAEGGSESYEHIHIKNHDEVMKQELSIKLDEEEESNYDHAIARGIDPVALEQDEYSHLNDANIRQRENNGEELSTPYECQYYNVSESTKEPKRTGKERKAGYEEPVGHTPNYFILEKSPNESKEDKHKFVLEEEENGDENDGTSNHDYFVLEKTETV